MPKKRTFSITCPHCYGKGILHVGGFFNSTVCPTCNGAKKIEIDKPVGTVDKSRNDKKS